MVVVRVVLFVLLTTALRAQDDFEASALPKPTAAPPNILLIVADDFGVDAFAAYDEHPVPAKTPVLDGIAAEGMLFRNAWATPGCSATRAMLLTGQLPRQTGIGSALAYNGAEPYELDPAIETLPKILAATHATAAIGKWHLGNETISGPTHPLAVGFDTHRGSLDNFQAGESFFSYDKAIDGQLVHSTSYATTDSVDDTLDVIDGFGDRPWFVVLNFNAPHAPFHEPPAGLHSYGTLPEFLPGNFWVYARAMGEAMDAEIGRLLAGLGSELDDTVLFFVGDNGTDKPATAPPWNPNHAKGTAFEGGVNVPLVVAGRGVSQGECDHLVSLTDLYATIAELTGVEYESGDDSRSFARALLDPLSTAARSWVFSEAFRPNGPGPYEIRFRMLRDERYKLINRDLSDELDRLFFYDLWDDPFETVDLLGTTMTHEQLQAYDELFALMIPYVLEEGGGD